MKLNKPTLLIFTDWYTPGFKAGGPIQSIRNMVESLKSDFCIFIYTSDRDLGDKVPYNDIRVDEWNDLPGCSVFYSSASSRTLKNYRQLLTDLRPSAVYLNSLFSYAFTLLPIYAAARGFCGKVILAPRGMLHAGALSIKPFKKKVFLKLLRLARLFKRVHIHATDQQEYLDIITHLPEVLSIEVIPNFPSFAQVDSHMLGKTIGDVRLIYLGRIASNKNLSFLLEILGTYQWRGKIQLTIAGEIQDFSYWASCQLLIKNLPDNIQVSVRDSVPHHEVIPLLQTHHIFVLPTMGENFGHAIFEALLAGTPVIISDQTPWRKLYEKGLGWDIPLAERKAFKDAIQQAIDMDQAAYNQLSAACHAFAVDFRKNNETRNKYIELFG